MPLKHYGVLAGRPVDAVPEFEQDSPHYQIHIVAAQTHFRIAVNVKSNSDTNTALQYLLDADFHHPLTQQLATFAPGFTLVPSQPGGVALDYIRGNLFDIDAMRVLPFDLPGPDNDLNELVDAQIRRAIEDPEATLYAFGERWGPENAPDKVFHFAPGNGIHDIHMNQGNEPRYQGDDGVWQDGGLLIHFPSLDRWVGLFLKFQSQATHTEEGTGHRIEQEGEPGGVIRIVAAMVNPFGGQPEAESVILLNTSPTAIDLAGLAIADRMQHTQPIAGLIPAGGTLQVALSSAVQLGNKGGLITLLNAEGLKVDGVSYTREQAAREGWTVVF